MSTTIRMTSRRLVVLTLAALVGLLAVPGSAGAVTPPAPARIELPDGFQPEGITTGRGTTLYVGSLANGAIWRGDAATGAGSVFIPGIAGRVAVGTDFSTRTNRIWVAGGPTGTVTAYDATSGAELARYTIPGSGFLNDLVATNDAVYVTDSTVQRLVVIPLGANGALPAPAAVRTLPLTGAISYVAGQFNANGITAAHGGQTLIIVSTIAKTLYRVDARTGVARAIPLTGGALTGGDGIELKGKLLYVVRGTTNAVVAVKLDDRLHTGRIVGSVTSAGLDVPSTATFVGSRLYAVNARFGTPPGPAVDYWITRLPYL